MALITAEVDYVNGYLRYGHWELFLEGKELEEFKNSSKEDQESWLTESGSFELDDYEVNDYGDLQEIKIEE
jgi:hypothetical protein